MCPNINQKVHFLTIGVELVQNILDLVVRALREQGDVRARVGNGLWAQVEHCHNFVVLLALPAIVIRFCHSLVLVVAVVVREHVTERLFGVSEEMIVGKLLARLAVADRALDLLFQVTGAGGVGMLEYPFENPLRFKVRQVFAPGERCGVVGNNRHDMACGSQKVGEMVRYETFTVFGRCW